MRIARVLVFGKPAGLLREELADRDYVFEYNDDYQGPPVSLTLPVGQKTHRFDKFPPFFEGLLPEGEQLEALLRRAKLDRGDYLGQLMTVGRDLVGAVTVEQTNG